MLARTILVFVAAVTVAGAAAAARDDAPFADLSFDEARARAEQDGKLVVVDWDVDAALDAKRRLISLTLAFGGDSSAAAAELLEETHVMEGAHYYEAMLGVGDTAAAASVADRLLEVLPTAGTVETLVERARRAGADDAAESVLDGPGPVCPRTSGRSSSGGSVPGGAERSPASRAEGVRPGGERPVRDGVFGGNDRPAVRTAHEAAEEPSPPIGGGP